MSQKGKYGRTTASYESSGRSYPKVYKDSKGLDTIGIGHLVTKAEKKAGTYRNANLTVAQQEELFNKDRAGHVSAFYKKHPKYREYPQEVKNGLEDVAFNMGVNFLDTFKDMRTALDNQNFPKAATELITGSKGGDSKYVKDVHKERSYANAMRIADGYNDVFARQQGTLVSAQPSAFQYNSRPIAVPGPIALY